MVKSLNTEMAHTTKGTWFREGPIYGNIMVGNKAFEFYNDTKLQDYVQIPWDEINYVSASVMRRGKIISRFAVFTKKNGTYSFSTRDNKETLRCIRTYIGDEKLVRSPSFWYVFKHGIAQIPKVPSYLVNLFKRK